MELCAATQGVPDLAYISHGPYGLDRRGLLSVPMARALSSAAGIAIDDMRNTVNNVFFVIDAII